MKRLPVFAWLRAWYVALKMGKRLRVVRLKKHARHVPAPGHSYAINPISPATGGIVSMSSIAVVQRGHGKWPPRRLLFRSDIRAFALAAVTLRFYERNARRCAWFRRRGARPATPARARHSPTTRPSRDAARLCRFIGNTSAVWRSASVFEARRLGRLALLGTHLKVMKKCSETRRQRLLYCVVFDPETLPDYKQRSPF
jgi:hypothetical protein